jgi:hypothetical protein
MQRSTASLAARRYVRSTGSGTSRTKIFLELISGKEGPEAQVEHWESVRRTTAGRHVRANAANEIKLLEQANEKENQ